MEKNIRETICDLFRQKERMKEIGDDDNFFEAGVSSLTIIELQISVEKALGLQVETSRLMRLSSINEWIRAYVECSAGLEQSAEVG
jgi:acyl carrier protein